MPPADVLGCGELVSRCAHVLGFKHLGLALSSLYFTPSPLQGCVGMSQPCSGGTKGAAHTSEAVAAPRQETPLLPMPIDTLPAWGASHTLSTHLGTQLLRPLHPLHKGYCC